MRQVEPKEFIRLMDVRKFKNNDVCWSTVKREDIAPDAICYYVHRSPARVFRQGFIREDGTVQDVVWNGYLDRTQTPFAGLCNHDDYVMQDPSIEVDEELDEADVTNS